MKHIKENNITALSAGSFQANFEPSFMLDEHPKRLWKAANGISVETITAEISYGCSDIALFGTNAIVASVLVFDPNAIEFGDDASSTVADIYGDDGSSRVSDIWANSEINITGTFEQRSFSEALWIELNEIVGVPCIAEITVETGTGNTVNVGVIRAAVAEDYNVTAPETGINEGRRDFSIETQLQNGARYYKKRDIVRTFDSTIHMDTTEWYKLAQSYDTIGAQPTAWNLTTLPGTDWLIFGYIDGITGNHILDTVTQANITIIEVI